MSLKIFPLILRYAAFLACFRDTVKCVTLKEKELLACYRYVGVILVLIVLYSLHLQSACNFTLFRTACFVLLPPFQMISCGDL